MKTAIVSQLQGLFLRFHNRMVDDNPQLDFPGIQKLVRFHYQWMVLNDFLPHIVHSSVLAALKTDGRYDQASSDSSTGRTLRSCRWSSRWRLTVWVTR